MKLRPKSFEALKYLADNVGRLVPKSELIAALWPDAAVVNDDSLTHCIMDVRKALADTAQKIVRTIPGRGYLLDVPVDIPIGNSVSLTTQAIPEWHNSQNWRIRKKVASVVALNLLVIAGLGGLLKQRADRKWADESASRVEQLTAAGRYPEAYDLAIQVIARHSSELRVSSLMHELSDDLSVLTEPAGAEVYLRRLGSERVERVGVTPISHLRIARAEYILSVKKAGYAGFERTVSSALQRTLSIVSKQSLDVRTQQEMQNLKGSALPSLTSEPGGIRIQQELREASKVPHNMVAIPGGEYRLHNASRPTDASVQLADYFIDKFEVSNRDFKAFVDAGGYRHRQFWESAFDARLSMATQLRDKTGLPGPRSWIGGTFPTGKEMYPVTGITWHEARAYCRFRGKDLPTLFQWEKAAKPPEWAPFGVIFPWGLVDSKDLTKRANVDSTGLVPVNSFEFGMSHFGVYNSAGNVAEWIRNRYGDGYAVAGGSSNDPPYGFLFYRTYPALAASETLGCRCALSAGSTSHDEDGIALMPNREAFHYPVSSDREFKTSAAHYTFERTPLNAAILGVKESASWRREEIGFDSRDGQRMNAFLYLPRTATAPYQVIHYLGGGGLWFWASRD